MEFTVQDVINAIEAEFEGYESEFYVSLSQSRPLRLPTLGDEGLDAYEVEQYGGEGQGDEYYVVFKIEDRLFKKDAWYSSYDGTDWDECGPVYEVESFQKTITDYRAL